MKVPFDAAFLKHRMLEHKRWQNREAERMTEEIIEEIVDAVKAHTLEGHARATLLPFPEEKARRVSAGRVS